MLFSLEVSATAPPRGAFTEAPPVIFQQHLQTTVNTNQGGGSKNDVQIPC